MGYHVSASGFFEFFYFFIFWIFLFLLIFLKFLKKLKFCHVSSWHRAMWGTKLGQIETKNKIEGPNWEWENDTSQIVTRGTVTATWHDVSLTHGKILTFLKILKKLIKIKKIQKIKNSKNKKKFKKSRSWHMAPHLTPLLHP